MRSFLRALILLFSFHLAASAICQSYMSSKEPICAEIFRRLERQIVDSDANLYNLRKVFYPTSRTEPALVNVSYNLNVSSVANRSCPGDAETSLNVRYDRIPDGDIRLQFLRVHAWSSKIFYTLFHPATVNRLQPQALQIILHGLDDVFAPTTIPTAITWSTIGPILTVELYIDVKLPCWPTFLALEGSLIDLTSVLKVYADSQENVSPWSSEEKGYTLLGSVFIDQWWLFIQIQYPSSNRLPNANVILSILLTLMISFGCYYAIWRVAPANSDEKNFLFAHTFIWCSVAILLLVNLFLFWIEVVTILSWCEYESSCKESAGVSKIVWLVWMAVYMIIAFIVLLVCFLRGKIRHREILVPEWRAFIVATPLMSSIVLIIAVFYKLIRPLLKIHKVHNMWIHLMETLRCMVCCPQPSKNTLYGIIRFTSIYILYMTVFISASIFTFSLVPVLVQTFLFPFRIVAAYSFLFAAFVVYFLAAFVATFLWKEKPPNIGILVLYLSSTTIALTFILIILIPFVSLYPLLVSGSFSDNSLILFGASVLPTLLLSTPLLWAKGKLLPRFLEIDEEEDDNDDDSNEDEKKKKERKKKKKSVKKTPNESDVEMAKL